MELLERLFSLGGESRQGWGEKEHPPGGLLASVSPNRDLAGGETSPPCTPAPQNPLYGSSQTYTRGGRCPHGSTRPSSRTAAGSPRRSRGTPPRTPPHLPRGGFLSRCRRRKRRIKLGPPIPRLPREQPGGEAWGNPSAAAGAGEHPPPPQQPQGTLVTSLEVHTQQSPMVGVFLG